MEVLEPLHQKKKCSTLRSPSVLMFRWSPGVYSWCTCGLQSSEQSAVHVINRLKAKSCYIAFEQLFYCLTRELYLHRMEQPLKLLREITAVYVRRRKNIKALSFCNVKSEWVKILLKRKKKQLIVLI